MAKGGLSKLANLSITLQRRWSNVLSDQQRQHIVEMFLGLRTDTYFPSARLLHSPDLPLEVRLRWTLVFPSASSQRFAHRLPFETEVQVTHRSPSFDLCALRRVGKPLETRPNCYRHHTFDCSRFRAAQLDACLFCRTTARRSQSRQGPPGTVAWRRGWQTPPGQEAAQQPQQRPRSQRQQRSAWNQTHLRRAPQKRKSIRLRRQTRQGR